MWETKQCFETQENTRENVIFHEDSVPALTGKLTKIGLVHQLYTLIRFEPSNIWFQIKHQKLKYCHHFL